MPLHLVGMIRMAWAGPEDTRTIGNNVHAALDTDANNVPDAGSEPDGGAGLDFDFPFDPN